MRYFDNLYRVTDLDEQDEDFYNDRYNHLDSRIDPLERQKVLVEEQVARLAQLGVEQVTALLGDAAAISQGLAQLGTILSVRATSSQTIATGPLNFVVAHDDRTKIPSAAYIVATPVGVQDTFASGFMTAWDAETGAVSISVTTSSGAGTYGDWLLGLAAPDLNQGGVSADVADFVETHVEEEIGSALTPVMERIDVLEAVPPPDPTFVMAYAKYRSAA